MSFALVEAGVPRAIVELIVQPSISKWTTFTILLVIYIVLGMFMDALSVLVLTLPVVYPIVSALKFDAIWFGVIMVILLELALISPPVGMNVYVIHGMAQGASLDDIFKGAMPYIALMLLMIGLLTAWPELALWLPRLAFS